MPPVLGTYVPDVRYCGSVQITSDLHRGTVKAQHNSLLTREVYGEKVSLPSDGSVWRRVLYP